MQEAVATTDRKEARPTRTDLGGSCSLRHSSFSAFTLIEVMLAIAIMAVICGTIYQFTGTVILSSNVSMRTDAQEQSFGGLRRLLDTQFAALPTNETGTFIGVSEEGEHGHHDALQVVCPAGNAVLTPDAHGLYRVMLGLHELPKNSGHYTLVMERAPWSEDEDAGGNGSLSALPAESAGGFKTIRNDLPSDSVRLLDGVRSLEIAYYDPRLNSWQDKWNDDTLIPSLVRVRLEMENSGAPYEFVAQVPSGGIRRGLPTTNNALTYAPPGTLSVPGNGATVPGAVGPSGATVPSLPPGLTVPPPPPGGFTVPPMPTGFPSQPLSFPNAPVRGGGPR